MSFRTIIRKFFWDIEIGGMSLNLQQLKYALEVANNCFLLLLLA